MHQVLILVPEDVLNYLLVDVLLLGQHTERLQRRSSYRQLAFAKKFLSGSLRHHSEGP